jgi:hypothetical protein
MGSDHHSSTTRRILEEVHRMLWPDGRFTAMYRLERPRVAVEPKARGTVRIAILAGVAGGLPALFVVIATERLRHAAVHGDADVKELLRYGGSLLPLSRRRTHPRPGRALKDG